MTGQEPLFPVTGAVGPRRRPPSRAERARVAVLLERMRKVCAQGTKWRRVR